MKTTDPDNQDDPLRKVLQEWRSDTPLPPRFQERVWRRIEHAQAPTAVSVLAIISRWISAVLPRPALAASYVAILLVVAVTAGWSQGRQESARVKDELGQRYVRVLDPYQAPRH